jgi:hypothetical protein
VLLNIMPRHIHPLLHIVAFVVTLVSALLISGLIGQNIIFGGQRSVYDPGPFYIGLVHYTLMIPVVIVAYFISAKLCAGRIPDSNLFIVSALSLGSSVAVGIILDLGLKAFSGR